MSSPYPSVPDPSDDPKNLRECAIALKGAVEVLVSRRGRKLDAAVTWQDLVDLKLITPSQVPLK